MTVVLAMLDGTRPDALTRAHCPALNQLKGSGAYTLKATSVMPSITLPCHMSIFHSVPPTRHGIVSNDWMPMARPLPGLVEQAKAAGLRCAFFYNWEPLRNLSLPGQLALSHFQDSARTESGDQILAEETARYISQKPPDFTFVYFGTVDETGHKYGWMSDRYLTQLEKVDSALALVLDALPADSTVLVQSDHGGHDRSHGTDSEEDMTIPWLIAGPGIRQNYRIDGPVSLLDSAPTLAHVMGVTPHSAWEGRCVDEIFID